LGICVGEAWERPGRWIHMKEVDRWGLEKVSGLPFLEAWVAEGR
jgi:hypothetical protein